jgi:DNA-damage-inducible protein J
MQMPATAMIHVRVNEEIKAQATEVLAPLGLSVSEAVRAFLTRVAVEKAMPFHLRAPNAETRAALREADAIVRDRTARFITADELLAGLEAGRQPISRRP